MSVQMFKEMNNEEMMKVDGGGWGEFGLVLGGTLAIAAGPVAWAVCGSAIGAATALTGAAAVVVGADADEDILDY